MKDVFRMDAISLHGMIDMASPFNRSNLCSKEIVCVTLHWLATGSSARAQEQFFMDKSYSIIHTYRTLGLKLILQGLVENGFYGDDIHSDVRIRTSSESFKTMESTLSSCLGAIDGTHIPVVVPQDVADRYRNR